MKAIINAELVMRDHLIPEAVLRRRAPLPDMNGRRKT
jgi:hypothetical protein